MHREVEVGCSIGGTIWAEGFTGASLEREWMNNQAGQSCVPAGFYYLEPHDGTKYKGTFALIGAQVSHEKTEGVPRYACVAHKATTGLQLQGCFSVGAALHLTPGKGHAHSTVIGLPFSDGLAMLEGSEDGIEGFLSILKASPDPRHYLWITEAYPITTRGHDRRGLIDERRLP